MTITRRSCLAVLGAVLAACRHGAAVRVERGRSLMTQSVQLPAPGEATTMPVEQVFARRRSVRAFGDAPLTLEQLSQVLWAAQGVTHGEGFRTAPSAGALYPLELYVLVGEVGSLDPGVYKYRSDGHQLVHLSDSDLRAAAAKAASEQSWIADSRAIIVCAAVFARTAAKYGARGERYVHMEAGHAAQNVYLQATALGLGTTIVGAFDDTAVHGLVGMTADEEPLSLLPLGPLPA